MTQQQGVLDAPAPLDAATNAAPSDAIVGAYNISKSFGDVHAVRDVSFEIPRGTVFGMLGPNGAGKTTAVRMLTTLLKPDTGSARVAGYDVATQEQQVRASIGLAGQYSSVDENMTGRENLRMVGRLYHMNRKDADRRALELLERFDLTDAGDRLVKTYSGGMRRRLDLGASLVAHPPVVFLDEPTTGLDPRSRMGLWQVIKDLVAEGATVLLTTQYLEEADELADEIAVIDKGTVIAKGTAAELKKMVGGEVLELTIGNPELMGQATELLEFASASAPDVNAKLGTYEAALRGGGETLPEIIRRLDGAGITITNIAMRSATLDDVFLSITGEHAENADDNNEEEEAA